MSTKNKKKFIPHDIENDYKIHYSKSDGRYRAYCKKTKKGISYPRLIVENKLGRYLNADEDVHHIDEDKSNNDPDNLEVIEHSKHVSQHFKRIKYDEFRKCPIYGITFQWTDKQQKNYYKNKKRPERQTRNIYDTPFCSRKCAGIYGKRIQIKM